MGSEGASRQGTKEETAQTPCCFMAPNEKTFAPRGYSPFVGGEGLLGLQRAFAVAGCGSVVASLRSVHDAATSVLMGRFYLHLGGGQHTRLEAPRRAQLDVLRRPQ